MNYLFHVACESSVKRLLTHHSYRLAVMTGMFFAIHNSATSVFALRHSPDKTVYNIEIGDTVTVKGKKYNITQDSISTMLPETTVQAKSYLYTATKSIYTPTKRELNSSVDAMTLLNRMNIPQLLTSASGEFTASDGAPISYFINGRPASPEELTGMNMSDVKKVEYLDFPQEVNFMNVPHAINFIVKEYSSGGYTRLGINHAYLGKYNLEENIFSRWNHKDMTYDLSASVQNTKEDPYYSTSTDVFRFNSGTVERSRTPREGVNRFGNYPVKFRALYYNGPTYISNTVGFSYFNSSHSFSKGDISYKGFPSAGHSFVSETPQRISSLVWDGSGVFNLRNDWSMSALGNFNYSHYDFRNRYTLYGNDDFSGSPVSDIKNFINENAFDGSLQLMTDKRFSNKHALNLTASAFLHGSNMLFLDDRHKSRFNSNTFLFKGGYNLNIQKISLRTTFGVAYEYASMDGFKVNTFYPFGTVNFSYAINRNNNLSGWMQYSTFSPVISAKNPVVLQRDELLYTAGNPKVKPFPRYELMLNYLWQLGDFRLFAMFNWNHAFDTYHSIYAPMEGRQAMLETYVNSGHTDDVSLRLNFSMYFLNKKILVTATPEYRLQRPSYPGYPTIHHWHIFPSLHGFFGNFHVAAYYYSGKSRLYSSMSMDELTDRPHTYWFTASWGNGKIRAELRLDNIFTKRTRCDRTMIVTPYFDSNSINTSTKYGRLISLKFSYTFGYGKEIDRNSELNGGVTNSESGINL